MSASPHAPPSGASSPELAPSGGQGLFRYWANAPLYVRVMFGLVAGVAAGLWLGPRAEPLDVPARLILQLLGALAPALIFAAIMRALMSAELGGRLAGRLAGLLLLNTVVAILIGLLVANVVRPGRSAHLERATSTPTLHGDVWKQLLDNVPDSLLRPLVEGKVIGVVLIAVAFGVAARSLSGAPRDTADHLVSAALHCIMVCLGWVIALVPLAVFGKVASVVGSRGFGPFASLGLFLVAVLAALVLQALYYLARIRLSSWVRPRDVLVATRDALVMAFSTASSTVTMPVTFARLSSLGLREQSATMGALVGSNFNNDGTALYEAMAALFVAQLIGVDLSLGQQALVVITSVIASVGAAGIPEAGLVTMTLVFTAVKLPTEYIALLLTVDWFLDRCRTVVNVLGDINVACLLDGRSRAARDGTGSSEAPVAAQLGRQL